MNLIFCHFLSLFFFRSILDEARQVAELCSDPSQADAILKAANEIEAMAAALTELRSQGQVNENHEIFQHCSIYPKSNFTPVHFTLTSLHPS